MPYLSEKIKIKGTQYDRRIKLTPEQREEIKTLANNGWSQTKLAKEFGVSRRLIEFTICPDKYEVAKERFKELRKDGRYKESKEDRAAIIREHRRYKQTLKIDGKIK